MLQYLNRNGHFLLKIVAASDRVIENKYTYGDAKSIKTQDIRFAYYPHKKSDIDMETKIDKLLKKDDKGKRLDGSGIDVIFPPVPPHDDEDYWGYHLCLANNQPFCGIRFECSYTPPPPPAPKDKLLFEYVRTEGMHDGWLDGDLEIEYAITQGTVTVSAIISGLFVSGNISLYNFMTGGSDHDAGSWELTWTGFEFFNSDNRTYIMHIRPLNVRQNYSTYVSGLNQYIALYSDQFNLNMIENDGIFNDFLCNYIFYTESG